MKIIIATIAGYLTAILWSRGEQQIVIFIIATIVFQIFFVLGKNERKIEVKSKFAQEMEKYKNKFKN